MPRQLLPGERSFGSEPTTGIGTRLPGRDHRRRAARAGRVAVLVLTDIVALLFAGVVAVLAWAVPERHQPVALYLQVTPLLWLFVLGYAQAGLYPGFALGPVETLRRQTSVTVFGFLVLAAVSFALKVPHLYSRVTFGMALGGALILVPLARAFTVWLARRWPWWPEPVVVVGTGPRAVTAIHALRHTSHTGYQPLAAISLEPTPLLEIAGVPVASGTLALRALANSGVRVALLETESPAGRALVDLLQRIFPHVVLLRAYDDLPVEHLQIRNLGNLVGIEYTNNLLQRGNRVVKRAIDLAGGAAAFVLTIPLMAAAAALVELCDGGPALFFQDRAGLNDCRIRVPKIRTMRRDAERHLQAHLAANPALREEWETRFKLADDPRLIPRVGRFLRRFSLDELPQLWAVLTGTMSLVGPRPFPDYHVARFSPEFRELRSRVRPGITGLWQVTVRSGGSIEEQEALDSYYIRNWSVWLDLYILSRTAGAVFSGRGAY